MADDCIDWVQVLCVEGIARVFHFASVETAKEDEDVDESMVM